MRIRYALDAFAAEPFDLGRGPLLRAMLIHSDNTGVTLALCVHHLVCDGTGLDLLLAELAEQGHAQPPPDLQYGDYAVWERTDTDRAAAGLGTGGNGSPACRPCWTCRPTGHGRRPCPAVGYARCGVTSNCARRSGNWHGGWAPPRSASTSPPPNCSSHD